MFKNSIFDLGKALKAGLASLFSDKTEKCDTWLELTDEDSDGDSDGEPGMGSLRRPKAIIDLHNKINT